MRIVAAILSFICITDALIAFSTWQRFGDMHATWGMDALQCALVFGFLAAGYTITKPGKK